MGNPIMRPSIGLLCPTFLAEPVREWLVDHANGADIWVGHPPDPAAVESVLVWGSNRTPLGSFPNLKLAASAGAGVEHILKDPTLPANVRVTRFVDPEMTAQMVEWVVLAVLYARRGWETLRHRQANGDWTRVEFAPPADAPVGILGLGEMGGAVARALAGLGLRVLGWSRRKRQIPGVETFHGRTGLERMMEQARIVVGLLPHTPETEDLINRNLLCLMPPGSWVINAGRGVHLVEEDLLALLATGRIAGAVLDVTREEPLPAGHPFWGHPRVRLTMHGAAISNPKHVAAVFHEEIQRLRIGEESPRAVCRKHGY